MDSASQDDGENEARSRTTARADPARGARRPVARRTGRLGAAGAVATRRAQWTLAEDRCREIGHGRADGRTNGRQCRRSGLSARACERRGGVDGRRRVGRELLGPRANLTLRADRARLATRTRRRDVGLGEEPGLTGAAGDEERMTGRRRGRRGEGRRSGASSGGVRLGRGIGLRRLLDGRAGAGHGGRAVGPAGRGRPGRARGQRARGLQRQLVDRWTDAPKRASRARSRRGRGG